jgi:acetyl-CoA acetyltransferase
VLAGLTDAFDNIHMGVCAEDTATKHNITREEQDEFALLSYARATAAADEGRSAKEIVPVEVKSRRGTTVVDGDEEYKNLNAAKVPTLRTVFKAEGGTGTLEPSQRQWAEGEVSQCPLTFQGALTRLITLHRDVLHIYSDGGQRVQAE